MTSCMNSKAEEEVCSMDTSFAYGRAEERTGADLSSMAGWLNSSQMVQNGSQMLLLEMNVGFLSSPTEISNLTWCG